jgi:hypothetical protein
MALTLRKAEIIRARRRPLGVFLLYAFRASAAWLVALPMVAAIGATGVGHQPTGDAVLFEPGGMLLAEIVRVGAASYPTALAVSLLLYVAFALVGLVPLASFLRALSLEGRASLGGWLSRGVALLPAFTGLSVFTVLVQGALLGTSALVLGVAAPYTARLGPQTSDLSLLGLAALCLAPLCLASVAQDLCRAAIVRGRLALLAGVRAGLVTLVRQPRAVLLSWLWPALLSLSVIAGAAFAVGRLELYQPEGYRVLAVALLHQLAALALVCLRAVWLARSLVLVSRTEAVARTLS